MAALKGPDVEAVKILHLALRAGPLSSPQTELNPHTVSGLEAIQFVAAVPSQLKHHKLRVAGVVARLKNKLALAKSFCDLLRVKAGLDSSVDFESHIPSIDRMTGLAHGASEGFLKIAPSALTLEPAGW